MSDIVKRLRDPMIDFAFGDRLMAADELEDLRAALDKSAKLAYSAVHAERAAILELIEAERRANGHLYDGGCLQNVAAAIKARE